MNLKLLRRAVAAALPLVLFPGPLFAWSPKQAPLMTRWAKDVDPAKPLPDYPRPQMVRPDWLNLNGVWEYRPGTAGDALPAPGQKLGGEILVPFPVESALSGVMEHHDRLWYRRQFTVPPDWKDRRTLLHFGAVDFESEVFVNGKSAGVHKGGYLPFSYDVTPLLNGDGPQELVVRVFDPTDDAGEPRGKQSLHPGSIMYTPTTGIWQTVWLEPVAQTSIESLKIVPDADKGELHLTVKLSGANPEGLNVIAKVMEGGHLVCFGETKPGEELILSIPHPALWTPDNPFLYDLTIGLVRGRALVDSVQSYFGMRKIEIGEVNGVKRMLLNGKFVFEFGPLDQGFWPDGIYTAPTDAALKNDLEMMKACGFNMVRKHIKVEPARWYYWTDKLGLLVWQDMPSANSYIEKKKYLVPPLDTVEFDSELAQMVQALWNAPSIIMWDVFNEAQGQHDTPALVDMVRKLDPSRLVNEASGNDRTGHGDVADLHQYPAPGYPKPSANQALACGEFGGIGFHVPGHSWSDGKSRSNITVSAAEEIPDQYAEFSGMLRGFRDAHGLSAAVYTQLTDVENEINGLLTYDRVPKFDPAKVVAANHLEYLPPVYQPVLSTSDAAVQTWKYTTDQPADGWSKQTFDDAAWTEGRAPFGNQGRAGGSTPWTTPDIWLRKHFNPGNLSVDHLNHLELRLYHDDNVEVYLNGVLAYKQDWHIHNYNEVPMLPAAARTIVSGVDNVIAVHCQHQTGGQRIDVGIYERLPLKK